MPSTTIGIVGDFDPRLPSHQATESAIRHVACAALEVVWLHTRSIEFEGDRLFNRCAAFLCAPGTPYASMEGALLAIRHARERGRPMLGTCGGFHHIVMEYARNALQISDAGSFECDPGSPNPFIVPMACPAVGKRMRVALDPTSKVFAAYRHSPISETYRCSYELNPTCKRLLHDNGLQVVGVDETGGARVLEMIGHPFFVGTLFVPQMTSTAQQPHRLMQAFVAAAVA